MRSNYGRANDDDSSARRLSVNSIFRSMMKCAGSKMERLTLLLTILISALFFMFVMVALPFIFSFLFLVFLTAVSAAGGRHAGYVDLDIFALDLRDIPGERSARRPCRVLTIRAECRSMERTDETLLLSIPVNVRSLMGTLGGERQPVSLFALILEGISP